MSPPDTNVEKQKSRHKGPLIGMALVAVFGIGLITYWVFELFAESPEATTEAETDTVTVEPTETVDPDASVEEAEPAEATGQDAEVDQ